MAWEFHISGEERHIWPQNDEREHKLEGLDCWCNPKTVAELGETTLICHNSDDMRELIEQAEVIKNL